MVLKRVPIPNSFESPFVHEDVLVRSLLVLVARSEQCIRLLWRELEVTLCQPTIEQRNSSCARIS